MWLFHKDCQSSRVEVLSASPPGLRYRYERGNVAGDSAEASKVMCAHIDTSLGATAMWRLGHDAAGE